MERKANTPMVLSRTLRKGKSVILGELQRYLTDGFPDQLPENCACPLPCHVNSSKKLVI